MSNSARFSSGQLQESSTNGTGEIWPENSGTENSFLSSGQGMVLGSGTISFTYDELKIATNGFSSVNLLGQGGFGYVHRGMLQNGKIVAVKSLKADSGQGEREFQAEVETISRVHHKHLVTLVGNCITDSQKLLVYEYVQNKTMEFHLHVKGYPVMDWPTRLKIAIGAAKGLAYLHEDCHPKIIHRDIKAANILLDHSFEAKVADFGLAKFSSDAYTHISTRVMGTFGYLAPEYASSGQLSEKSDVFSFGVLLLELITGRRPVDFTSHAQMEDSLVDWARPLLAKALQDGNFDALVDPRLEKDYNPTELGSMITCAASCVRHSAKRRPRLSQVLIAGYFSTNNASCNLLEIGIFCLHYQRNKVVFNDWSSYIREAPPIDSSPPPPDPVAPIVSPPPPPVAVPPTVSPPPPPVEVPPVVSPPPPPVEVPPVVSPPPPPVAVPPVVSPPPPPVVVPPTVSPPPPPVVVPPPVSPPPPPDVVPPPPDAPPPTESPPPPPLDAPPPTESPPPPSPDVVTPPPIDSPPSPPPNVLSPPPALSPPSAPTIPSPSTSHSPPSLNPKSPPPAVHVPPPPKSSSSTPIAVGAALGSVALLLAVFGLFWFLCVKKRRRRNPHELESHYKPGDGYNGASGYPPSGQQFPTSSVPPSQLAAQPSMSTSADFSSGQPHQSSGGAWSHSSGAENPHLSSGQGMVLGSGTIAFTYDDLKIATNGFSSVNLLGQGGFGYVHKGMLQNGKIVAVKSLKSDSGQGEREFQAEVETISRVHHKHLVTLVGYCITDSQKLLVYEYVENKTMEFHLHGKGQPVMDWPTRLKIAIGAAKGLAYLHEDCHPKIIHRDIKAANILLDHSYEAQVADFGLAKFSSDANTHVSTRVMGTFGYLAPEYASSGQLSEKSDVFSFGVLLLELVTGRRPVDFTSRAQMEDSLVDWARPLLAKAVQDGNFDALVDPRLEKDYNPTELGSMITCAASCVRHSAKRRPQMSQVVRALEGHLALSDLNDGVKPGFSSLYSSADLYDTPNTEDMSRFRRTAYGDDEESSEYSVTRNEFTGGR